MNRVHRTFGTVMLGAMLTGAVGAAGAQGSLPLASLQAASDPALRAQVASITLDAETLPGGYTFSGEAFLGADQIVTGDLDPAALTDAGFDAQYVSEYEESAGGSIIRSYVSVWPDADAATAGFALLEDEAVTLPGADVTDSEASVGEEPRETTTGTYTDPADESVTINTADVTFRIDRFGVGVAVETTDGETADAELASSLAAELEGRATAAVGGENPDGTDLAIVPQVLPVPGTELQSGFLNANEVETLYGLSGSSLGSLTSSWAQVVSVADGDVAPPFVAVGLTTFEDEEAAAAVLEQAGELGPALTGAEPIEGLAVEGADGVTGVRFISPATGASEPDSARLFFQSGSSIVVIDVQGAPSAEIAESSAVAFATAQAACIGQASCAAPEIPADLVG